MTGIEIDIMPCNKHPTFDQPELARIHQALEAEDGNRAMAARRLGMSPEKLRVSILGNPELRLAWCARKPEPVPDDETLSRKPFIGEEDHKKLALQLLKEDRTLTQGLKGIGLNQTEVRLARALGSFNQKHFFKSVDMIGAGVTRTSIKLQTQLDSVEQRLTDVRAKIGEASGDERKMFAEEEHKLMESYIKIAGELRNMFEISNRSTLLLAGIRLKLMGHRESKPPINKGKLKPGFTPTVIEAETSDVPSGVSAGSPATGLTPP